MSDYLLPAIDDWVEWGALFTDVERWRPLVERLWANDHELQRATGIGAPGDVKAGYPGTCAVFIVDNAAVVKIFPPMVAGDAVRESAVLRRFVNRMPFAPSLLSEGVLRDRVEWPYLVMTCLPGVAWRERRATLTVAAARDVLGQLGEVMRRVHGRRLPARGSWPSTSAWDNFLARQLPRVGPSLSRETDLPGYVIAAIETELAQTNWSIFRPRLLHADLTEDHLLVVERDGRVSLGGLIDWADAEVGDPTYDLVAFWYSVCRREPERFWAFMETFDPAGDLSAGLAERLAVMTFLHRFGPNLIGEIMTAEEQRAVRDLAQLKEQLTGGLKG